MSKQIVFTGNAEMRIRAIPGSQPLRMRRGIPNALVIRDSYHAKNGYEILQYSHCEGWVNNLYDENKNTYVFATIEQAIAELQEEFDDWNAEIKAGERDKADHYDITTFQIKCIETGKVYALDLIGGKVIVARDSCADKPSRSFRHYAAPLPGAYP